MRRVRLKRKIKKRLLILSWEAEGAEGAERRRKVTERKGIKISNANPLYVINIDAEKNFITVGDKEYLEIKEIELRDLNLLGNKKEFEDLINIKEAFGLL